MPLSPEIDALLRQAAVRHNLPPEILLRIATQESGGNPAARSPKGALGVMQLMPATAQELGVTDPLDPAQNVDAGARYYARMLQQFGGDHRLALAAYNAGPGAVQQHGGVPPFNETRDYVQKIAGDIVEEDYVPAPNSGTPAPNSGTPQIVEEDYNPADLPPSGRPNDPRSPISLEAVARAGSRVADFIRNFPQHQADFTEAALAGMGEVGVGLAQVGARVSDAIGLSDYNPDIYQRARAEQAANVPPTTAGSLGRFTGGLIATVPGMLLAPEATIPRLVTEAGLGALTSEAVEPGTAGAGAVVGGIGAGVGRLLSTRSALGRRLYTRQAEKAQSHAERILAPTAREADEAAEAAPYLFQEGIVKVNPLRNSTSQLLRRAQTRGQLALSAKDSELARLEAQQARLDVQPVRGRIQEKIGGQELTGSQVPTGTRLSITMADIVDDAGNLDTTVVQALRLNRKQLRLLAKGKTVDVRLPESVVPTAADDRHAALAGMARDVGRVETGSRAAEAASTGAALGDVPRGLPVRQAVEQRRALDYGKYRGVVPMPGTAAGREAERAAANAYRAEINTQFPALGEANETAHQLLNIETMLTNRLKAETVGSSREFYARSRGLAQWLRAAVGATGGAAAGGPAGAALGAAALPVASDLLSSPAWAAMNAQVRSILARQISSGNFEAASRTLARVIELNLGDEEDVQRAAKNAAQIRRR